MTVAVIGQGSIGRRHAQILLELGQEVVAFDPDPASIVVPGTTRAETIGAALDGAAAAVIASPSSEHARQARAALELGVPVMVEKPLATDFGCAMELAHFAREREVPLTVAMNLRHHPGVRALRELVTEQALGPVLSARAWSGSWLPGWRPGTDYRTSYSARSALGGGVLHDVAVHELDYLLWLLGPARSVTALAKRVSALELDVEDVAMITLELAGGAVAQLDVDYFDRSYHRGARLVGEQGTAHWSWEQELLTVTGGEPRTVPADPAVTYRRQMESFLAAVRGEAETVVDPRQSVHVLAVLEAARTSSRDGRRVAVPPALALRPARPDDGDRLLEWRNDPDTRRWSRSTSEVTREEHLSWLERTLADPRCSLWIGEADYEPVGQIRATREAGGVVELHVAVAPEARGRGFGTSLILEATATVASGYDVELAIAHVNPSNESSLRAFKRAGFAVAGADQAGFQRLERRPCR